jgi:DNA-binding transcriptional regulator YiaG
MSDWNDETIKALREHLQLTQVQMAQELGTRQQTISEWEVGMYKPRGGMARLLTIVAERANFAYSPRSNSGEQENEA